MYLGTGGRRGGTGLEPLRGGWLVFPLEQVGGRVRGGNHKIMVEIHVHLRGTCIS